MPLIDRRFLRFAIVAAALAALNACSAADRLASIGQEPMFEPIDNPTLRPDYRPVDMPMPQAEVVTYAPNSLWRTGAQAFFKDQRANRVGDLVTVLIDIADEAQLDNQTTRSRDNTDSLGIGALFGYEAALSQILPEAIDPENAVNINSALQNTGVGSIDREETVKLKLAAVVTQRLPNGNVVIEGSQEMRVNYELRALQIRGIVRPEDIEADNTISYEKIAEARIAYGGRGQLFDVQQPRYGSQVLDIINPF
ncbi:MAG: flagellar basal body L-ring protein [Rhodospirillaceae bacterium]|nr:flagellar basal body L-ring protein [Rhodospirillaceae bacterium]